MGIHCRRPVRVLHVTFNMGFGGTESVIRALALALPVSQAKQEVVCIDGHIGEIGQQLQDRGVRVSKINRKPGFDRTLVRSLKKLIASRETDIIHCHQYTPWVYGCLASLGTGARVVFTEHGRFYPDRYRYKAIAVNPILASLTRRLVAISGATRDALARFEFLPRRRIEVVYNGIQPLATKPNIIAGIRTDLGLSGDDIVLGTVARLDLVKNQTMMLEAIANVAEAHPQVKLVIVGDGPERSNLESRAFQLGIANRVIFTGFSATPANYLGLMDIFLLSSDTEGTSMTLLEAMSLGLPVVATNAGGTPEIVLDKNTGLLTPVGDTNAFAKAIERLVGDPDFAKRLGKAGLERFTKHYSVSSMANAYLDIYNQVTARKLQGEVGDV